MSKVRENQERLQRQLMEAPGGKIAEDEVMQEVTDNNRTDFDQLMAYWPSLHDTTGMFQQN